MYRGLIIIFVIVIGSLVRVNGQESSSDLKTKIEKLEKEIAYTNTLIEQTRKSKQVTLNELRLINSRIAQRNELIATLKKEILALDIKIESAEISLRRLSNELTDLKDDYSRIISFAYRHQTAYNKLIYIFSADDLNQAYQRLRYLEQVAAYIRNEADTIKQKEIRREKELGYYNQKLLDKRKMLDAENTQMSNLEREQIIKTDIQKKLAGTEKQLRADLRKKEREAKKLNKRIEEIIARETKRKEEKTAEGFKLSPEDLELSALFEKNKGKLPWPVKRGMISEKYGVHRHPVLKNVKTKNNGINFATSQGEEARTVFEGQVVSITTLSSTNIAVIVKHGDYFTVYSNLENVYVNNGDVLETKQLIGKVHTTLKGKSELHFQVWKGKAIQDPSTWILKQ